MSGRKRTENYRRTGNKTRCHRSRRSRLLLHGFPQGYGKALRTALPSYRSPIHRQLHHHAVGFENFQLCRTAHRIGLYFRQIIRPAISCIGRTVCRLRYFRPYIYRLDSVHDYVGLYRIDPIRLCRDAQPVGRRDDRLCCRHPRLCRKSLPNEKNLHRQRLPYRLRSGRYTTGRRRIFFHHRLRQHDKRRTHARTPLLRSKQHFAIDHR